MSAILSNELYCFECMRKCEIIKYKREMDGGKMVDAYCSKCCQSDLVTRDGDPAPWGQILHTYTSQLTDEATPND